MAYAVLAVLAGAAGAGAQERALGGDAATPVLDGPAPPTPPAVVSRDAAGRVTVRANRIPEPIVLDGRLDEAVYQRVASVSDFIQQEPLEGEPATERTEAWILFDDRNLYVSARCWDSHPERMVANELRRDHSNLTQNENFAVVLDTFYDRRNSFFFHTNPLGGLTDALTTDERNVNKDWNTVWDVKTGRFDGGWIVEMEIPFKSLRYKAGASQVWGVNLRRRVAWKNEDSFLSPIPASYGRRGITKTSSAGTLVGIQVPGSAKNLEIKPYAISDLRTDRAAEPAFSDDLGGDVGFDVKYGLTRSLIADFTVNTDFAQVEDDEEQVNLTRFSLFFPEKRDFFLEGQGIFAFGGGGARRGGRGGGGGGGGRGGGGGGQSNIPIVFFSRRIGLTDDGSVPIRAGGRVTGRAGAYTLGLLNIQTGEAEQVGAAATNFSVVRLKRDVLRRSNIGIIGTSRSVAIETPGSSQAFGVDANLSFYQNVNVDTYYARTLTSGLSTRDESYRAALDYSADRYGVQVEHLAVGENFSPEIGFLRRTDFRQSRGVLRFSPRPRAIRAIRKVELQGTYDYITNWEHALESREMQARFRMEMENSDNWNVTYERKFEFLEEEFEISDGIFIPVGAHHFANLRAGYSFGPQRRLSGRVSVSRGEFFDGNSTEARYRGRIELTPRFSVEPNLSYSWVDLPAGYFTARLAGARVNFTASARLVLGALVQYNSSSDALSSNVRFRWEYEPGSDLFVVYSEGRDTLRRGFPVLQNRSVALKLTRLLRF